MFRLLATTTTTECKRQQIAILIISFFVYVSGIRNEGNNMLLQQQQTTIEYSNYQSPVNNINQQPTNSNFRPSAIIDFTPADAAVPQQFRPTYIESTSNSASAAISANNNSNTRKQFMPQKQEIEKDNRRYTIEKAEAAIVTYENIAEKQFSFPNEQQQTPQHLTDKPIYIYRDPYTNENYHYKPTETNVRDIPATLYNHNNYNNNNNVYNQQPQQQQQHHLYENNDNQEYLVQSSMIVGTQPQQQQQQQQQQPTNPFRPFMSLSADKDVYLKRPGLVYDEKSGYIHPNSLKDQQSAEIKNKISYDSHDYPPPSYFQQQTSNFLPTPVPATPKPKPKPPPSTPPNFSPPTSTFLEPFRENFRPTLQPSIFGQQYLQSSQSSLPNYVNNVDNNYLLHKQPSSDYYSTEVPPPTMFVQKQPQLQLQYETRPTTSYEYDTRPPSSSLFSYSSPPSYVNTQQPQYPPYESVRPPHPPPPGRPSYNNYYDYQIGEIPPPQEQATGPPLQHFNYPYPRPPNSQYPYQGPYRPPPPPQPSSQQQSGLASLVQYAPQFTSLLLNGVGGGGGSGSSSNNNSPLGSLLGALTGTAGTRPQQSLPNINRRPVNSQLIRALENIARNDDLQCVPKVLCQMIAGQTQRGQLPAFITSPTITNFLAGFPAASPALIYGRAALLGLSGGEKSCHQTYVKCPKNEYEIIYYLNNHRGGFFKFFSEPEEQQQNVNHDATQQGGATSLFSILAALTGTPATTTTTPRPTPKPQAPVTDITSSIGNFFTQLLSDYMGGGTSTVEYQRSLKMRTKRSLHDKIKFEGESTEEMPSRDVFRFEEQHHEQNVLKFKDQQRQESHADAVKFQDEDYDAYIDINQDNDEDFHDEEDGEDTQQGMEFQEVEQDYLDDTQSRILHKTRGTGKRFKFFPETRENPNENDKEQQLENIIKKFNDFNRQRKLKFPSEPQKREYEKIPSDDKRQGKILNDDLAVEEQNYGHQFTNYVENSYEDFEKESKQIKFVDDRPNKDDHTVQATSLYSYYLQKPTDDKTKFVFPEREGKILNRPYYASSYLQDYFQPQQHQEQQQLQLQLQEDESQPADKFILPDNQRPSRYNEFPSASTAANIYNTHINALQSQNSFTSNTAVNNNIYVASSPGLKQSNSNHFLPTPPPPDDTDYTLSNAIYTNSNFNSNNKHNLNSLTHREFYKTQRYPSSSSSSALNSIGNNFYKPQRYTTNSYTNNNRYYKPTSSSNDTTRRPYAILTTEKPDDKNIYVTNSRGVTEYYLTPDGRKVYL